MKENYAEEFTERKEGLKREFPSQLPKQTKVVQIADRGYGKNVLLENHLRRQELFIILVSFGLHLKTGGWPSTRGS